METKRGLDQVRDIVANSKLPMHGNNFIISSLRSSESSHLPPKLKTADGKKWGFDTFQKLPENLAPTYPQLRMLDLPACASCSKHVYVCLLSYACRRS